MTVAFGQYLHIELFDNAIGWLIDSGFPNKFFMFWVNNVIASIMLFDLSRKSINGWLFYNWWESFKFIIFKFHRRNRELPKIKPLSLNDSIKKITQNEFENILLSLIFELDFQI